MSFSPQLVNERNLALNNCPTKSGRCQIYKTYYLKMKDAYENYEEEIEAEEDYDDEDDEDYEEEEEEDDCEEEYEEDEEDDEDDAIVPENEIIDTNATEYCCCRAQANEEDEDDEEDEEDDDEEDDEGENEFGCAGCNYEWRDGYKNGWRDAMKYIATKTHKEVPDTPACSYCDIVCKTRKCGGKCGGTSRYCSVDCQKQDWAFGHKDKCGK
jgi:hypothetical protein